MYSRYILSTLLLAIFTLTGNSQTIYTQQQFEMALSKAMKGEATSIKLLPGNYHLSEPITAKGPLSIIGLGATISAYTDQYSYKDSVREIPTHYVCKLKHTLEEYSLMVDQDGNLVEVSETVDENTLVNTTSRIDGTYEKKSGVEVHIPIPQNLNHLKNKSFQKAFGYFDCGWTRICFKLKKTDEKYLYCETLHKTNVPRYDYEKTAYNNDIRFVIYNAEVKPETVYYDSEYIYIPKFVSELNVKNCNVYTDAKPDITINGDVSITGVTFDGINGIRVNSGETNKCSFIDCTFTHTLGNALTISKKTEKDFVPSFVTGCKFEECSLLENNMLNLRSSLTGRQSIFVSNCYFSRYPSSKVAYKNTSAMVSVRADSKIADCVLYNTCRCHLYLWEGHNEAFDNIIFNTSEFNSVRERNLSNDWGLIYVDHVYTDSQQAIDNDKHKVVIDGCLLYGAYSYANDARGIMIDDGRGDVICRYNLIMDCQLYSIDSREVKSFIGTSSIRNLLENNLLGNRYRLAGGSEVPVKDRPVSKGNVQLAEYNNVSNKYSIVEAPTIVASDVILKDGKAYVSRNDYKIFKKIPFFKEVRKNIKKL